MKRTLLLAIIAAALISRAADSFVFSTNGVEVLTAPRPCPAIAASLNDGFVCYGVLGLPDAVRGPEYGWYRVLAPIRPDWATNHVASVTNTVLSVAGTAQQLAKWTPRKPAATSFKLDRDKVKAKLRELGQGSILENWNQLPIELVQWYFCEMEYVPDGEIAKAICIQFGWTKEQLDEFANACRLHPLPR